jgi:hypothetical protein
MSDSLRFTAAEAAFVLQEPVRRRGVAQGYEHASVPDRGLPASRRRCVRMALFS